MNFRTLNNNPYSVIASNAVEVSPSNSAVFQPGCLYIGVGGTLKIKTVGGQDATLVNVANGSIVPIMCTMVYSTTTDCTDIYLLY